jgi:signal transduction histidine kinase/ligand-binding sensor domain-containing protein/CheY-like chemotaxis protein
MIRQVLFVVITLCVVQGVISSSAVAQQLNFHTYSTKNGLPGDNVWKILQDRNGYLWFATNGGVAKFDGLEFTSYTTDYGLPHNMILSMLEDREGNLWFGTAEGAISKFDGIEVTTVTTVHGSQVLSMLEDREGNLWFGTRGSGIRKFDGSTFTTYTTENGLPSNVVWSMMEDREGNLWFGTGQGGGPCRFDGIRFIHYPNALDGQQLLPGTRAMLQDSSGTMWFGTWELGDLGIGLTSYDGNAYTHYGQNPELPTNGVYSILEDRSGNLWFGTSSRGVIKYDGTAFTTYTTNNGLPVDRILSMLEDAEGNLWIGTYGGGVTRLAGEAFAAYTTDHGLPNNNVESILGDRAGNLWIATEREGIIRLTDKGFTTRLSNAKGLLIEDREGNLWLDGGNTFQKYDGSTVTSYPAKPPPSDEVKLSLEDSRGNLWFGTGNAGVCKYDGRAFTWFDTTNGLAGLFVKAIHEDRAGNIWFATDRGLSRYDGAAFTTYTTEDGLASENILCVLEDSRGHLWFYVLGEGVSRYDGTTLATFTTADGLSSNNVQPLVDDGKGNMWFVTETGVSKYDGNRFTNYAADHTVFDNYFRFLIREGNRAYIGSGKGLFCFDPATVSFREYTTRDGLSSSSFNQEAAIVDSQGRLWFGTRGGITRFDPRLEQRNDTPPPVHVTGVRIFNRDTTAVDGLELSHDDNFVRFEYIGLSYTDPEAVEYRYQLQGLNPNWVQTPDRYASYSSLSPGDYTFKVAACNNEGVWSEKPATFALTIHPPYWATWWFRGFAGLLIATALFSFYRGRTRVLRRRAAELETVVAERTVDLITAKEHADELMEQANQANKAKSMFLSNMSHELRTPLNAVLGYSQILHRDTGTNAEQRRILNIISNSGEHLLGLINDVLDLAKIEAGRAELKPEPFDLPGMLQSMEEMFRVRCDSKGLSLDLEILDGVPKSVRADLGKLRQVLINLLGNAVKFTGRGGIGLTVGPENGLVCFLVRDTGPGIPEDQHAEILQPFKQDTSRISSEEGTGLGLAITASYVKMLGGELQVDSTVGVGSTFSFAIPLEKTSRLPETAEAPARRVAGLADGRHWRVLVADDKFINRDLLERMLVPVGFEVRVVEDGQAAVDVFPEYHPQLVLMDIRMPVLNGYEATRRIKAMEGGRDVSVIALTASALEQDKIGIMAAGCADVVTKPFREEYLFEIIAKHIPVQYVYETEAVEPPMVAPEDLDWPMIREQMTKEDLVDLDRHLANGNMPALQELGERLVKRGDPLDQLGSIIASHARNFNEKELEQIQEFLAGNEV